MARQQQRRQKYSRLWIKETADSQKKKKVSWLDFIISTYDNIWGLSNCFILYQPTNRKHSRYAEKKNGITQYCFNVVFILVYGTKKTYFSSK